MLLPEYTRGGAAWSSEPGDFSRQDGAAQNFCFISGHAKIAATSTGYRKAWFQGATIHAEDADRMKCYKCLFVDWHLTLSTSVFWEQFSDPAHPQHRPLAFMQSALFAPAGMRTWLLPWMRGAFTSEEVIESVCRGTDLDPVFALQELQTSCQQMRLVSEAIPQYVADLRAKGLR